MYPTISRRTIFVAILQWVFDEVAREELIADIAEGLDGMTVTVTKSEFH